MTTNPTFAAIIAAAATAARDAIGIAAVGSIAYGAWLAWPPAGFIVGGVLVLVGVVLSATARKTTT